ncbi:MAG: Na+/H+ antiporter NhaA, partial [Solirubrobacteraceae bacterium]|nr:Na+/H+ antiporter NhaA [Solirubrobacteraceae bacterium]
MTPDPTRVDELAATIPPRTAWEDRSSRSVREFLRTETGSAGLLLAATLIALVWANSPAGNVYEDLWGTYLTVDVGGYGVKEDLGHWVNDGLMVFFFYIVGLEIRRELVLGELRDWRAAAVPAIAALAGMVVPALIYFAFNFGTEAANGWGIVMATDIAFVLGALSILGNRIPPGVRVFLLTLAIVDDVGAIAVIAAFYSDSIDLVALGAAGAITVGIWLLLRYGPPWRGPAYFLAGFILWYVTLKSGIHPTIAGVVMGLLTAVHAPQRADVERAASVTRLFGRDHDASSGRAAVLEIGAAVSPNERFQAAIHPYTSYVVIPIFALANAGVVLSGEALSAALTSPITIGVVAGLVVGKALGISAATLAAVRMNVGPLPAGMRRGHVFGAASLAGIGFTVSLFVADLAFSDPAMKDEAKVGVIVASIIATAVGLTALVLRSGARAGDPEPSRPTKLDPPVDPVYDRIRGHKDAEHTLVLYTDYECPYCREFAPVLDEVFERADGRVRYVVRQLPLEAEHPGATLASEAALSAAAQGRFWEMHDRLLAHPPGDDLGPADLLRVAAEVGLDPDRVADDLRHHVREPAVQAEVDGAARSGVSGTPTLFLDGTRLDGSYDV